MKPDDKDKLNKCLDILDTTDLGLSLVWLWTWSTIKEILAGGDWDQLVSEDEAWELLAEAVASGNGFSLEYGTENHYEEVMEWMFSRGLIADLEDIEDLTEEDEDEDGTD